jgi:hypothetical protein
MQHTLRHGFTSLSSLARSHDELPAFNAAYWVLTFLAAMMFNAGAFLMLIVGHMALDVYKYRDVHGKKWKKVAEGVARENMLDLSLLSLGIAFGVYCHSALPLIAGLRGLVRTELAILNAVVQVAVKTHVLHGVLAILANVQQYLEHLHPHMGKKFTVLELVSLVGLATSFVLLIASPWLLSLDALEIKHMAADMLIPWKL